MRVYTNKSKIVIVATSDSGGSASCPTLNASEKTVKLRDDYNGKVKLPKSIIKSLL